MTCHLKIKQECVCKHQLETLNFFVMKIGGWKHAKNLKHIFLIILEDKCYQSFYTTRTLALRQYRNGIWDLYLKIV